MVATRQCSASEFACARRVDVIFEDYYSELLRRRLTHQGAATPERAVFHGENYGGSSAGSRVMASRSLAVAAVQPTAR